MKPHICFKHKCFKHKCSNTSKYILLYPQEVTLTNWM